MLCSRGEVSDRIVGLELGADDYLPKPFEPRDLAARIQSFLRRRTNELKTGSEIKLDDLLIALEKHTVNLDSEKEGQPCLDYNKRIYFSISGSGKLLENYGTPTKSTIMEAANGKVQIEFKPMGFDKTTIEVRNQDFKGHYININ